MPDARFERAPGPSSSGRCSEERGGTIVVDGPPAASSSGGMGNMQCLVAPGAMGAAHMAAYSSDRSFSCPNTQLHRNFKRSDTTSESGFERTIGMGPTAVFAT